jgi:hypothetical protein
MIWGSFQQFITTIVIEAEVIQLPDKFYHIQEKNWVRVITLYTALLKWKCIKRIIKFREDL